MPIHNLSPTSTLTEIADAIATYYYHRDYPSKPNPEDTLDLTVCVTHDGKDGYIPRLNHGFQSACRAAALVPHVLALYIKHVDDLNDRLKREINAFIQLPDNCKSSFIRSIQTAALMRESGRFKSAAYETNHDVDVQDSSFFSKQSQQEFEYVCVAIGLNKRERRSASVAIELNDIKDKTGFGLEAALLSDALTLESMRFNLHNKQALDTVNLSDFALIKNADNVTDIEVNLVPLMARHLDIIKAQHGRSEFEFETPYSTFAVLIGIAQELPFMHELHEFLEKSVDVEKKSALQQLYHSIYHEVELNSGATLNDAITNWRTPLIRDNLGFHRYACLDFFRNNDTSTNKFIHDLVRDHGDTKLKLQAANLDLPAPLSEFQTNYRAN